MEKEILTVENIKRDVALGAYHNFRSQTAVYNDRSSGRNLFGKILSAAAAAIGFLIVMYAVSKFSADTVLTKGKPLLIAGGALFAVGMIALIYLMVIECKHTADGNRSLKEFNVAIAVDTLESSVYDYVFSGNVRRHLLVFKSFGNYLIPNGMNYCWSDEYYMSDDGVYNTSVAGNTFYIVYYREDETRTPVMVYNTKFFEWQG